ncbi:glycoside hydrolase family 3 protein [Companilactobacillus kimchiensis]|uniref:beta-N-acetylhexosaminidase n=1 Tax=Companilactobacillus kimchiensis TaxID=993692 RepID=A0A0R2LB90_9LACO|nr:glycoside hydrolase family 3 N-terminal domain-containing protein [Companilactobacillus kimchiensis]KRN98784.1 beta-hexosamidase a, glycoside hydrolase family 3 [Companilactobacillus kimchiensis]
MLDLTKTPYNLSTEQISFVEKQLKNMSLNEKIGQLFFVIGQDEDNVNISEFINKYHPGGMMYRPDTSKKIKHEVAMAQKSTSVPMFIAANLEAGGNGLLNDGTWFGRPMSVAATDDAKQAFNLGDISGYEAAQVGDNMSFSPIVDLDQNFRNPIMNVRTFGSDKSRVIKMVDAEIKGLEQNNVIPVAKHFPGDGVDERDQHLVSSVNSLNTDDWMNSYGQIYRHLIKNGLPSIMIAHIMQPAWERKLDPGIEDKDLRAASTSKLLIDGLLHKELNFNGLTITDATPMLGYTSILPRSEAIPATINAGIDMILFNKNIDEDYKFLTDAVNNGTVSMDRVDEAIRRIFGTKLAQGIMNTDGNFSRVIPEQINLKSDEHKELTEDLAKNAITLVKDRDKILPVNSKKYPRVRLVVLGDNDDGGFKEGGHVTSLFKKQLEHQGFKVSLFDRQNLDFHEVFEEGVQDLKDKFDLAIYVANIETASNQTTTRIDWIHLMAADAPWFMRSIPTLFISMCNPYHLFDLPDISTMINAYTGNPESIQAVVKKITGQEPFMGKSPVDPFCNRFDTRL